MKKIFLFSILTTVVLLISGCSLKSPDDTKEISKLKTEVKENAIILVMSEANSLDTIAGMTDQKFKEEVERMSNGDIVIDIRPSGVLGAENDILDTMVGGADTVDMARISAYALANYGAEKSAVLSLPYTFVSRDHFWKFANSDVAQEILMEPLLNGSGIRGLFYAEEGFRHFFTKDPVTGIESLKGKKLRVANDPVMNGLVHGLGASPTIVSFSELYSALQTGVVDGAEQPTANYKSNAFNEVAPNLLLDGHTLGAMEFIIIERSWNKLSPEQQQILIDAGKAAAEYNRSISEEKENEVLEQLSDVNIVEVKDKTAWQDAVKDVVNANIKGHEELYQKILDMGK